MLSVCVHVCNVGVGRHFLIEQALLNRGRVEVGVAPVRIQAKELCVGGNVCVCMCICEKVCASE